MVEPFIHLNNKLIYRSPIDLDLRKYDFVVWSKIINLVFLRSRPKHTF